MLVKISIIEKLVLLKGSKYYFFSVKKKLKKYVLDYNLFHKNCSLFKNCHQNSLRIFFEFNN